MAERREVRIAFLGDARDLQRATQTAERSLASFEATSSRVSKGFGLAAAGIATGVAALGAAGIAAGIAGKSMVDAASSYEEAASKANAVFGASSQKVQAFSKSATKSFGISERKALDFTGQLGALLRPMGFTEEAASDMSTTLVGLAGDFASFYNTPIEDALVAIRAGLVGEIEPLRRFGVQMDENTKKAKAMSMGLYSGKGNLSAFAEAQATMAIIMEQSKLAQGDFIRTQDSTANRLRVLGEEWDNFKVRIGEALLPIASWLADTGVKILDWLTGLKTAFDQGGWSAVWDKVRSGLEEGWNNTVWPFLAGLPAKIVEGLPVVVDGVRMALAGLATAFTDWASQLWSGTEGGTEGLDVRLGRFFSTITTWVSEHKKPIEDTFNEWKNSATQWVEEASKDLPGKMEEFFAVINKWVEDNSAKITEVGVEIGAKVVAGMIVFGLTRSGPLLTQFVVLLGTELTKSAIRLGYEMGKGVITGWLNLLDQMPAIVKDLFGLSSILAELRRKLAEGDFVMTTPPGRAIGGPVAAGMPYIVGERGPELFVPRTAGTIVPNGAGSTYVVNADGLNATQALQVLEAHERMALAGAA